MEKHKVYLIGSIQDASDGGVNWRDKLTKTLIEFGFDVLDPCRMECNHSIAPTIEEQKKKLENLKRSGQWETWDKVMGDIQQSDIVCVNQSKFVIVLYDADKKLGGTIEEIVEAHHKKVPMYVVSYSPFIEFNDWVLARIRQNFKDGGKIFPNFKQLTDFIEKNYKDYIKEHKNHVKQQEKEEKELAKQQPKEPPKEELKS